MLFYFILGIMSCFYIIGVGFLLALGFDSYRITEKTIIEKIKSRKKDK